MGRYRHALTINRRPQQQRNGVELPEKRSVAHATCLVRLRQEFEHENKSVTFVAEGIQEHFHNSSVPA